MRVKNKKGGRTQSIQAEAQAYNIPDLEDNPTPLTLALEGMDVQESANKQTGNPQLKRDPMWNKEPFSNRGIERASGGMGHDLDRY